MGRPEAKVRWAQMGVTGPATQAWNQRFLPAGFSYAQGGGEHQRNGVEILGLDFARGDTHVGKIFELLQQVDQGHGIDQSGGHQRRSFVERDVRLSNQSGDVVDHLLSFGCHVSGLSPGPGLRKGCSRRSFSRVAERDGLPAVLFTIHFGGLRKIVFATMPRPATTSPRRSFSIPAERERSSSRPTSATMTISSVPRSEL